MHTQKMLGAAAYRSQSIYSYISLGIIAAVMKHRRELLREPAVHCLQLQP